MYTNRVVRSPLPCLFTQFNDKVRMQNRRGPGDETRNKPDRPVCGCDGSTGINASQSSLIPRPSASSPPFLHTASDQKLEVQKAWEQGYHSPRPTLENTVKALTAESTISTLNLWHSNYVKIDDSELNFASSFTKFTLQLWEKKNASRSCRKVAMSSGTVEMVDSLRARCCYL